MELSGVLVNSPRVLLLAAALALGHQAVIAGPAVEARGVWLTLGLALKSQSVEEIADTLADQNMNLVLLLYERDEPVREFIDLCHGRGIEVHFWVTPSALVPRPRDEWLATGYDYRAGTFSKSRPDFTHPAYIEASQRAAYRLVRRYEIDGIHLDGVRYGLPWDSLGPENVAAFERDTGIEIRNFPDDIIKAQEIRSDNVGDPAAWRGEYINEWTQWRCQVMADFFGAVSDYVRERRPDILFSNACMTDSESALYYGVDYRRLAPHLDFFTPMAYFNRYGRSPEWAIERSREIAIAAHAANPNCRVYAGVATYSHSRCRIWIADTVKRLREEGNVTQGQIEQNGLLDYFNGQQMRESARWLHDHGLIDDDLLERVENAVITDEEIARAVELMREPGVGLPPGATEYVSQARLDGIVFFRYYCMFAENTEGVVGDLWGKLTELFKSPASLPHRR